MNTRKDELMELFSKSFGFLWEQQVEYYWKIIAIVAIVAVIILAIAFWKMHRDYKSFKKEVRIERYIRFSHH